ncbi:MAG TPA: LOG family protein [Candidatus Dormibacteraeota bacterium]|nr:LOG family protein [Candidatus Dormibacteraeota bacterium]
MKGEAMERKIATEKAVVVFGSSRSGVGSPNYVLSRELGDALGRRGAEVRCGGYAGVMEGVAEGAKAAGGRVVGCTLDWFEDTRRPNGYLDEVLPAPDLPRRLELLLQGTSAAIALPGGIGTLNEVFWLWTLLLHGKGGGRKLILLGTPWLDLMMMLENRFEVDPPIRALVHLAASAEEAAEVACGGSS